MYMTQENNTALIPGEFQRCASAQIEEIMKYKWYLGERMKRDPLECMSMNEICVMWIEKYAEEFRRYWLARQVHQEANKN